MGSKAPDVLRHPPAPEQALTLAEIHVAGWELRACCSKCGLALRVSTAVMAKAHGPDFVPWGHTPRCPRFEPCAGRLVFSARSIAGGTWRTLRDPPPQRLVELWKSRRISPHLPPR